MNDVSLVAVISIITNGVGNDLLLVVFSDITNGTFSNLIFTTVNEELR